MSGLTQWEPVERTEVLAAFKNTLQNRRLSVGRESELPYPKELISHALCEELVHPTDPETLDALEVSLSELESFLPDEEFELVCQYEEAFANADRLMKKGDAESIQQAGSLIAGVPKEAREIRQKIIQRQKERIEQIRNIRELRSKIQQSG